MANPSIDVVDHTFVVADPEVLAARFADQELWRTWWPGLELTVFMDRGPEGVRWTVRGAVTGSAEIWLESWRDGVIVHWFLRAEPADGRRVDQAAVARGYATDFKRRIHRLKDELEHGRDAGVSRLPDGR